MRYGKTSVNIAIFTLLIMVESGASFAKSDSKIKEARWQNAVGIATSSLSMRSKFKEKFVRSKIDTQSFLPIDKLANKIQDKIRSK